MSFYFEEYESIIKGFSRRAKRFAKKHKNNKFNPFAESGFIDEKTLEPISAEELDKKYVDKDYRKYKLNLLIKMAARDYLKDRQKIMYNNLLKIAEITDNQQLKNDIKKQGYYKTVKKILDLEYNDIYIKYENKGIESETEEKLSNLEDKKPKNKRSKK